MWWTYKYTYFSSIDSSEKVERAMLLKLCYGTKRTSIYTAPQSRYVTSHDEWETDPLSD